MFGIDDALLGAGVSALATYMGGRDTNAAQQDMSSAQMAFQERMSNTAYQRQVEDLNKAGLNPMLAYMKGSAGASTPPGSMAVLSNSAGQASDSFSRFLASAGSSAESFARSPTYASQIKLTDAQAKQADAITEKVIEETKNVPLEGNRLRQLVFTLARQEDLLQQQAYTEFDRRRVMEASIQKLVRETDLLDLDLDAAKKLDNLGREYGQLKPIIDTLIRIISRR